MKLVPASLIADDLLNKLDKHFKKFKVCGSIRRKCEEVNDVDVVAILKPESAYEFGDESIGETIHKLDPMGESLAKSRGKQAASRYLNGDKIKRFLFKGILVDLYLANEETFETLVLIRTGSKEHNIKLTTTAKYRSQKLFADGTGLCEMMGDNMVKILETTEDGILKSLLDRVPLPEERN